MDSLAHAFNELPTFWQVWLSVTVFMVFVEACTGWEAFKPIPRYFVRGVKLFVPARFK